MKKLVIATKNVPRRGMTTIAAYINEDIRQRIRELQEVEAARGNSRASDSWVVTQALHEYIIDENRDLSIEDFKGDGQILGYVSKSTKAWVKKFGGKIDRPESWVAGKAIAVFLRSRGL